MPRRRTEPRPRHFQAPRLRRKYVRWDDSGIHLHGTYSSEVRGKTWLIIRADVRKFLSRHGVCRPDQLEILRHLTDCNRKEHEALQHLALNSVCLPGRPAKIVATRSFKPV